MLSKSNLENVLADWSFWRVPPPESIPRRVLEKPLPLVNDLAIGIQGVRRCGKSTLLTQIMTRHALDPAHCTFVNLEDPRLSDCLSHELLEEIWNIGRSRAPFGATSYFLFDEIQAVDQWEKWVHSKLARPSTSVIILTGSNSTLLAGDLGSKLTGRHLTLEVFPFDFAEFRLARKSASFDSYLSAGGFPRALSFEPAETLLREYFSDIIERDVRRHVMARTSGTLIQLAKAVFEATGSELSQRKLSTALGISVDTAGDYLAACESAYVILPCPYFSYSERKRLVRNQKYYPIDLGLCRAIITKGGADLGKSLKTVVFHELRRRHKSVSYWRGKGEVDFVVEDSDGIKAYQVSWDGMKDRHFKALTEFKEEFPQDIRAISVTRENVEQFLNGDETPINTSSDRD